MYTIVFQETKRTYRLVLHAPDADSLADWLACVTQCVYLLILDANNTTLLHYTRRPTNA